MILLVTLETEPTIPENRPLTSREISALEKIEDSSFSIDGLKDLFPNPDFDLASAASKAKNIYFAQSFKPQPEKKEKVKQRTEKQNRRLQSLEAAGLFIDMTLSEKRTSALKAASVGLESISTLLLFFCM